jgi:hypothetical protein
MIVVARVCQRVAVAEVFVFEVEDIDASSWVAEVAVLAPDRQTAVKRLRLAGLHKKQIHNAGRPVRRQPLTDFASIFDNPDRMARRRLDDGGWTDWAAVEPSVSLDWRPSGTNRRTPRPH